MATEYTDCKYCGYVEYYGIHTECELYYIRGFIRLNLNLFQKGFKQLSANPKFFLEFYKIGEISSSACKLGTNGDYPTYCKPWVQLYVSVFDATGDARFIADIIKLLQKETTKEQEILLESLIRLSGIYGLKKALDIINE